MDAENGFPLSTFYWLSKGREESCGFIWMLGDGGKAGAQTEFNLPPNEGCSQSSLLASGYLGAHITAPASVHFSSHCPDSPYSSYNMTFYSICEITALAYCVKEHLILS